MCYHDPCPDSQIMYAGIVGIALPVAVVVKVSEGTDGGSS